MTTKPDLTSLIKSYDVRGVYGDSLTEDVTRAIAAAFADVVVLPDGANTVAIGRDMRDSGVPLTAAFVAGLNDRGVNAITIGMCSTDGLYHASGSLDVPGAMITASHNPAEYNGIKLCRSRARAVGENTGLAEVRELAATYIAEGIPQADARGSVEERDMLARYGAFLRSLVDLSGSRPLKVVVDAANAMGGYTVPAVLGTGAGLPELPLEIIPLYFELDGTFPNHEANPLEAKNLVDLQAAVLKHGADVGLAFDGDADRCFAIDEKGNVVAASTVTALVGLREAKRDIAEGGHPTIVYNLVSSMAVPELLHEAGAITVRSKVGHSNVKALMAEHNAVFGGEHSAHFYFRDFWYADSGMLAAMHVLAALGEQPAPLSAILSTYSPYHASGEINSKVPDTDRALERIRAEFVEGKDVVADELDGLSVIHWDGEPKWWLSVRASNTEPVIRVNVEADDAAVMADVRDRALAAVTAEG